MTIYKYNDKILNFLHFLLKSLVPQPFRALEPEEYKILT